MLPASVLDEIVPLVALVALLVVAFRHPRPSVEVTVALLAAAVCLPLASSGLQAAADAVRDLLPVVVFLAAILVVSAGCADTGLFRAVGERLGRGSPTRFLTLVFVAAVAVTAVLSLDATVVLLTLVVLAAAGRAGVRPGPGLAACVRLANSSSLLLPVSNLTTLLALKVLPLSFTRFALVMAPTWGVVVLVEYAVHRLWFRRDLAAGATSASPDEEPPAPSPLPRFPLVVVLVMLLGFVLAPVVGLSGAWGPAVVALLAAVALGVRAAGRAGVVATLRTTARESSPGFVLFVLALGVVVDAVGRGGLGDLVDDVARGLAGPAADGSVALWGLVGVAVLATLLANLVNNLPATLLLLPAVAPLGTTAVLATLVGLNVGSSLTWSGSLANLLWRRTLLRAGHRPGSREFHTLAALAVPPGVLLGVLALWAWSPLVLPR